MAAKDVPNRKPQRRTPVVVTTGERAEEAEADAPAIDVPKIEPARLMEENPAPFTVAPRPFPHRMSLDLDEATYTWLRDVAHEHRVRMGPLVRELLRVAQRDEAVLAKAAEAVRPSAT